MSELSNFLKYTKAERNAFVDIALTYSITDHLVLRTGVDSLLIAYDQMAERLRLIDIEQQKHANQTRK